MSESVGEVQGLWDGETAGSPTNMPRKQGLGIVTDFSLLFPYRVLTGLNDWISSPP